MNLFLNTHTRRPFKGEKLDFVVEGEACLGDGKRPSTAKTHKYFEKNAFSEMTIQNLKSKGYILKEMPNPLGRMDCILLRPDGKLEGGSDPRGDNMSVGY